VSDANIAESGPHRVFDAGAHPTLTVDIGYADLTIRTNHAAQFDVSVRKSTDFGFFRATAPMTARADGDALQIGTTPEQHGWTMGDDRMVTVLVPPATRVVVLSAGDIEADGLRAETSIASVGMGDVTIDDYDAPTLHVKSNGRIALQSVRADRLDAIASDGRVIATALRVRDGNVESKDGNVSLRFASDADTLVHADTDDGTIRVPGMTASSSTDDASSRAVRVGSGQGHIDVHTESGDIMIEREQ
jgi:hypothetical protein